MNVFDRSTNNPCPVCLELAKKHTIKREMVMPIPEFGPLHIDGRKCCFDCQSALTLVKIGGLPEFTMARLAVGNERLDTLRMPDGLAECMGMCSQKLIKPANIKQLHNHLFWLDSVYPLENEYED